VAVRPHSEALQSSACHRSCPIAGQPQHAGVAGWNNSGTRRTLLKDHRPVARYRRGVLEETFVGGRQTLGCAIAVGPLHEQPLLSVTL
jgi:hypothetical protein